MFLISGSVNAKQTLGEYELLHTLGKGMSGKVKLGKDKDGKFVAIKIIFIESMTARSKEHLQREVKALMDLQHPNIMRLIDVYPSVEYTKKNGEVKQVVALVLELADSGELFEFIMHTGKFPESLARTYFLQLVDAMSLCQRRGISHRDLKPENVLLDSKFDIKVADFGLASLVEESPSGLCKTKCGTTSYMAPEVLVGGKLYDGNKADVWSAGVILFIMIAGNPPFEQASSSDWWFTACRCGRYDRFWAAHLRTCPDFPTLAQDLLNKIFVEDPSKRLSFEDIKAHPWMKSNDIWDGKQLQDHLNQRLAKVKSIKAANKKKSEQKKRKAKITGSRIIPFAKKTERDLDKMPKPTLNALIGGLFSELPIDEILLGLERVLMQCNEVRKNDEQADLTEPEILDRPRIVIKQETCKIKALFERREVEIKINIYQDKSENPLSMIHILRINGDAWKFESIRKQIIHLLEKEGIITESTNSFDGSENSGEEFDELLEPLTELELHGEKNKEKVEEVELI